MSVADNNPERDGKPEAPEPVSGTALSDDPVLAHEPSLPNHSEYAPKAPSAPQPRGASAEPSIPLTPDQTSAPHSRNWIPYAAYATGALALSIPAIVLGHLGMARSKAKADGDGQDFALAGLILGYIALAATIVGLWFLTADRVPAATIDVYAQQDVSAVGAAAASAAIATGQVPEVTLTDTGYVVAGQVIDARLTGQRTLNFAGDGMAGWCLDIGYDGGEQAAFSYGATTGLAPGPCSD